MLIPDSIIDTSGSEEMVALALKKKAAQLLEGDNLAPIKAVAKNLAAFDTNRDGFITADDCPFDPGSAHAQIWWDNVAKSALKYTKSLPESVDYQDMWGDKFIGFYHGKPVILGHPSPDNGNLEYMMDRLKIVHGLSTSSAQNISDYLQGYLGYR